MPANSLPSKRVGIVREGILRFTRYLGQLCPHEATGDKSAGATQRDLAPFRDFLLLGVSVSDSVPTNRRGHCDILVKLPFRGFSFDRVE